MKKTIKVLIMLFLMIFFSNFHSFALDIKTLNNEINIDILKDKNDILVLKSEIINENYEDETYIRNYKNILIKYTDNKEVFKINLSNKSIKKNKKSIYQMPKSLVYIDNKEYYVVENTDNNFFSVTKISSNGKKLSQKSFSGTVTNIKKINENELILIGGSPAFIIKINKDDLKEEQKVLEDNSSIFNDFIVTKDYFLMVGEDYITKESLMIKYDKTLKKLISMSLGYKEFTKIIENKDKSYFLLGENNLGGILTKYSNKEKIIFQKEQEKNIAAKVIYVYEELDQTIIFNYLLEKKEIDREYWALVSGQVPKKNLIFKDKIGRDRHDRRKRLVDPRNGQYAETHVIQLKEFKNKTSLVRCRLKTGRTHQIRVHLSHHHLPIIGDPLYNPHSRASRLMLHAFRLSFNHPLTLEKMSFTALSDTFEKEIKKNG